MRWVTVAGYIAAALLATLLAGLAGGYRLARRDEREADTDPPGLIEETNPEPAPPITRPADHTTPEDHRATLAPPDDDAGIDDELEWLSARADDLSGR